MQDLSKSLANFTTRGFRGLRFSTQTSLHLAPIHLLKHFGDPMLVPLLGFWGFGLQGFGFRPV